MTVSDHSHRFVSFISPESPAPALHMINIPTAQEKAEKAGVTPINTKPSPATCSALISAAFVSCFCYPSCLMMKKCCLSWPGATVSWVWDDDGGSLCRIVSLDQTSECISSSVTGDQQGWIFPIFYMFTENKRGSQNKTLFCETSRIKYNLCPPPTNLAWFKQWKLR